jgi:hypothetical protein
MEKTNPIADDAQDIDKGSYYALSILMLLIIVLAISPMLGSGFISDDSWASTSSYPNVRAMIAATYDQVLLAAKSYGHLTVLFTFLNNLVFYLSRHDPFLYKLIILGMILVNVVLFEYFIYKLSRSRIISLLSIVSLPLLFQFRNYHDPILSFVGAQQMILTTLLISLIFLLDYFNSGNKSKFWLSVLFYFFCLQIYENTYSFFVFHLLIAYLKAERKDFLKLSLPFVVLPLFLTIILVGLKHFYPSNYTGTVPSYDIIRIVQTFSKQVFAAFPFSYILFFFNETISYDRSSIYHHYVPHVLLLVSVTAVFVYYFCKSASKDDRRYSIKYLFIFGLLFLLVPGMLISLSQKYQQELTWGLGYIPVYLSYYGTSLLIALLLALVLQHVSRKAVLGYTAGLCLGVLFCSTIVINYVNNRIVVDNLNYTFLYPREIIEEAAQKGLFKPVEVGSLLYINGDHHWDGVYYQSQRQFYELLAPRKFTDVVRNKDRENFVPLTTYKASYYLNYASLSQDSGYAVLGRLEPPAEFFDMHSKEVFVYVRVPYYKPIDWDWNVFSPKLSFLGKWSGPCDGPSDFVFYDYHPSIQPVASGIEWRLYKITPEKQIDPKSLLVLVERKYFAMSDDIEVNGKIDFRNDQHFPKGWSIAEATHRWSQGLESEISFKLRDGRRPARKVYTLAISAASNGKQHVTVLINGKEIGTLDFAGQLETKTVHFDSAILLKRGLNKITMKVPDAHTPGNGDPRVLGIRLAALVISEHR